MRKDSWLVPLTGVLFIALFVVGGLVGGDTPTASEDSAKKIVDFYVDNKDTQGVLVILEGIAGSLFLFFGGYLRRVLRDAEGQGGILSSVAFAGVIIFAAGLAIDATITIALVDTADDIDPVAVQALSALYNNDFLVFALGLQVFLLATGLSIVRHGALPKWIGWIAIVLAVIAMTPAGFFAFLASGLLILLISVLLAVRARAG